MQSILLKCFNFGSAITNLNLLLGFTQARGQVYNVCNLKLFFSDLFTAFNLKSSLSSHHRQGDRAVVI